MERFRVKIDNETVGEYTLAELDLDPEVSDDLGLDLQTCPIGYSAWDGGGAQPVFEYTRIA